MAYLEIETPEGSRRVGLAGERLTVGRLAYNDIVLAFGQISRQHAELRYHGGQWWIADLHSTNGLVFDAHRIERHAFVHGDQILLAPGITLRFVDEAASPASQLGGLAPAVSAVLESWEQPQRSSASKAGAFVPSSSVAPLPPRSAYSSDETPYVPPGMAAMPAASTPPASSFPAARMPPPTMPVREALRTVPGFAEAAAAALGSTPISGPTPRAVSDLDDLEHDLYRRESAGGAHAPAESDAGAILLHVCQTCGQRTNPAAAYCQNCHQPIARECPNCRLSLLPIQQRCPRCHTPNASSVRRAQPGRATS